jgi:hypothetical protein
MTRELPVTAARRGAHAIGKAARVGERLTHADPSTIDTLGGIDADERAPGVDAADRAGEDGDAR